MRDFKRFVDDKEQKRMLEASLLSKMRWKMAVEGRVLNADHEDYELQELYNCYHYIIGYIKENASKDLSATVDYLYELSGKLLPKLEQYDFDYELPEVYKYEKTLNNEDDVIKEHKLWHYEVHSENGTMAKIYNLLTIFSDKEKSKEYILKNFK